MLMKKLKSTLLFFALVACVVACVACGKPASYTVTFVNWDDTVLQETTVTEGVMPEYTVADPTREATAQYTYTFVGWDKMISPATENITYKAVYSQSINTYLITFADDDGTVLFSK